MVCSPHCLDKSAQISSSSPVVRRSEQAIETLLLELRQMLALKELFLFLAAP